MERRNALAGKCIALGVTGSIAAYKAVDLVRKLREQEAVVRVIMTKHASHFVGPLTFETLSNGPVLLDEFAVGGRGDIGHIEFTDKLDAAVIAPATANVIGKLAAGIADDALTSAIMALGCPLIIAPAMNTRMYRNPVLQRNISTLRTLGVRIVDPGTGSLACGTMGEGRLADTERIIEEIAAVFCPQDLAGRRVIVTAGPTREPIDAVRFISNPSSGKMGFALAAAARERGAEVILISGPVEIPPPAKVTFIPVITASEMRSAVYDFFPQSSIVIMAAAVSDFKPVTAEKRKIKKDEAANSISLERTADILAELGNTKARQILVGFAAETDDIERNALSKLKAKNLDMIIANDVSKPHSGFGSDANEVVCYDLYGRKEMYPRMPKQELARILIQSIAALLNSKSVS